MSEKIEPRIKRHITEFSDIPRTVESVFEKGSLHLKEKFVTTYLEAPDSLQPEQLKNIETHLNIPCEKCAKMVQNNRKLF